MVCGLSHIVYTANTSGGFHRTKEFYECLGFKSIKSPSENEVWLKLSSNQHVMTTDIVIHLLFNPLSVPHEKPSENFSLNESALSLTAHDITVQKKKLYI
jgi:hypothetical protein